MSPRRSAGPELLPTVPIVFPIVADPVGARHYGMAVAAMIPDDERRRQKILSLMGEYIQLIFAEMTKTKTEIDALLDEQARQNELN